MNFFLQYEHKISDLQSNSQNDLAVKLNSGKPVSHCLTWVAFSLIWVMLGDSSVNSLSKQLVSLSPFSFGTYGGVTFPWRGHSYNQNLYDPSQEPARMQSSPCHGSRGVPSLLWLHLQSQSFAWGPELVGFKRSGWYLHMYLPLPVVHSQTPGLPLIFPKQYENWLICFLSFLETNIFCREDHSASFDLLENCITTSVEGRSAH